MKLVYSILILSPILSLDARSQNVDSLFHANTAVVRYPTYSGIDEANMRLVITKLEFQPDSNIVSIKGRVSDQDSKEPIAFAPITLALVVSIDTLHNKRTLLRIDSTRTDTLGCFSIRSQIRNKEQTVLTFAFPAYYDYDFYLSGLLQQIARK